MKSSSPNNGLKSVGEISFEATPLKSGGEATPLWLGIDRVGSGLCYVAVVKKPLCDDPVKGWNH
jgi:hypothetical protein